MTREETAKLIKIMQHFVDGGEIESRSRIHELPWDGNDDPYWNWYASEYRIKETQDQFTDWSVLPPEYRYIFRDDLGRAFACTVRPAIVANDWNWFNSKCLIHVNRLTLFKRGTCDWQDSLIKRPEGV